MTRWTTALTAAAALGASLLAASSEPTTDPPDDTTMVLIRSASGHGYVDFTIGGRPVRGLYPGKTVRLKLTITNRQNVRLRIVNLEGRLIGTSRRSCPSTSSTLTINTYTGRLPIVIPAHSDVTIPGYLPVTMPRDVTSRCADTGFIIGLRGTAVRADR